MANNEAKIRFTAETGEFNSAIKKANSTMSQLRSELKLNDTQMKSTGATVEALENKHKILSAQLAASESKTEALTQKVNKAAEIYGENSDEVSKLKTQLANAQTAEEKIRQAISACNDELEAQREAANKTESETEKLTNTIEEQQSELDKLKQEYVEAVLKFGETSDEATSLGNEIDELSGELKENRQKMSDAEQAADDLDNSLDDVGDGAESANDGFTTFKATLSNLASDAIRSAIESIKELAKEVVELGINFSSAMSEVQAISGASVEELEGLEATAREFGATTVFSATESAEALKYMALAGWDVEESTSALGGILNLAAASGMDLAAASDMCTDYLSAFGMQASDSAYFADMLAYAQSNSNTTAEALGEAYKNCAANLNAAGQDVETVTSLLAMMANQGLKGSEAGTALTAVMRDITAKMDEGAISIGDATVAVMDANGNYRDLTDILKDVESATDGMGDAEKAAALQSTFTSDSIKGLNLILNAGVDEAASFEDALRKSSGTAEEMSDIMNDNLSGDLKAMNSAFEEVGLALFESFEEPMRDVVQLITGSVAPALQDVANWLSEHPAALQVLAGVLGVVSAAIAALTVVVLAQAAAQWVMNSAILANPITWIVVAIVAAIATLIAIGVALYNNWDSIKAKCTEVWESVKATFSQWGEWINSNVVQPVANFFAGLWDGITSACATAWEWVKDVFSSFVGWIDGNIIQPVLNFFTGLWDGMKTIWEGICNVVEFGFLLIKEIISAAFQIITIPYRLIWETCKTISTAFWNWIKPYVTTAINAIKTVISNVMNTIKTVFSTVWNAIKSVTSTVWNAIKSVIGTVWEWIYTKVSTVINKVLKVIRTIWNTVKSVTSTVWNAIKTVITTVWNGIKSVVTSAINAVKTTVSSIWNSIKSTTTSVWNAVKTTVSSVWEGIKSTVSSAINNVKSSISSGLNSAKSTVASVLDSIKSKFTSIWDNCKSIVSSAIEKIKSCFNFTWSLPTIKLPHISITGSFSLSPPSVPKFSISWYKDGAIFTKPTLFNTPYGLKGVGEAGAEAVLPIEKLEGYISGAIEKTQNVANLNALVNAIEDIASRPILLNVNGRQVATATASDSDSVNGLRSSFRGRGLVLD